MKFSLGALAMLSCALVANSAFAQTLKHPVSVRPVSLSNSNDSYYGYYYGDEDEEEASPSDAVAEPEPASADPVPAVGLGCYDSCCDSVSCDGGCSSGCGCGSCFLLGDAEPFTLFPENDHNIKLGGWTQFGYHNKATPLSAAYGDGLSFNDVPGRLNLQQQWAYIEKSLSGDACSWDWGGRVDLVYGTDAQKTQAFGQPTGWDTDWDHGVYGWALPQAYLEVGRGNFSVKAGHFFTLAGYEVVTAPDNFFYSHALTMFNSEPFTHTGALATYGVSDNLELYGGWTLGWDTGFDQFNQGSSWLGGFALSLGDCATLTYISTAGNLGFRGRGGYSQSVVLDVALTEKLNYVFQSDWVKVDNTAGTAFAAAGPRDENYGINQYLLYSLNDCWGVGSRMEWWKANGLSNYDLTLGLNYRPMANLVFRPEIRHDWTPGNQFDQTTFGVDAILTY